MTRVKSIKDIGSLYESMYSANNVIEEKAKKFPKGTFPEAGKEVKTSKAFNESGPNKAKGVKKAKKAKKNKKNSRKKVYENINSSMKSKFDKLFENVMDDEMDVNMDLGPGAGPSGAEDMGDMEDMGDTDLGSEMGGEEVTLTLDKETAQKLIDVLQAAVGGEEEFGGEEGGEEGNEEDSDLEDLEIDTEDEDSSDEDEEEEDEDEDEDEANEATEIEKLADSAGHKLASKDNKVSGTLSSTSKGKASSDVTDKVGTSTLGDKSSHLTKHGNNEVGNLKQGGSFFGK